MILTRLYLWYSNLVILIPIVKWYYDSMSLCLCNYYYILSSVFLFNNKRARRKTVMEAGIEAEVKKRSVEKKLIEREKPVESAIPLDSLSDSMVYN